jgi:hypothetical protein
MKKAALLTLIFVILAPLISRSDEDDIKIEHPNTASVELLGRAGLYSLDFDRLFTDTLALGLGLSIETAPNSGGQVTWIVPLYLNYYFGNSKCRPYLTGGVNSGGGYSTGLSGSIFTGTLAAAVLGGGYEWHLDNGLVLRAAPYLFWGSMVTAWFGISAGYRF